MVQIKTDGNITSIRGRFGGQYYKTGKDGIHAQTMPRSIRKVSMETPIIYPSSPGGSRAAYIKSWTCMIQFYKFILLWTSLIKWGEFSFKFLYRTRKGDLKKLNPYQWFLHYGTRRDILGLPPYTTPPRAPNDLPKRTGVGEDYKKETLNFYEEGIHNEKPYYKSTESGLYLYREGPSWFISPTLGETEIPPFWFRLGTENIGFYEGTEPKKPIRINY